MARILIINGIGRHGIKSVDLIIPPLRARGHTVIDVWLPRRNAFTARWFHKKDVKRIRAAAEDGDSVVCHSFGGIRTAKAMPYIRFANVFMFRPAMARSWKFKSGARVFCIHSLGDIAVWVGSLAVMHPFGLAGVFGFYRGAKNIKSSGGHIEDFTHEANKWADMVDHEIRHGTA